MDKNRYHWLKFFDKIFPEIISPQAVKVYDKRVRYPFAGYYFGVVQRVYRHASYGPFSLYIVRDIRGKDHFILRDHLEVLQ